MKIALFISTKQCNRKNRGIFCGRLLIIYDKRLPLSLVASTIGVGERRHVVGVYPVETRKCQSCNRLGFPAVNSQKKLAMGEGVHVFGYIYFGAREGEIYDASEERRVIEEYALSRGLEIDDIFTERRASLLQPFAEREEGGRILQQCGPGDAIIIARIEWILSSASEGGQLLQRLRKSAVSLHCIDVGGDISLDERRRLRVHEGYAGVVQKLLKSLAACESKKRGQTLKAIKQKRKKDGKYLGGPVPFGWEIDEGGFFVQNASQQAVIEAIIGMREDRWSYRDISARLKKEFDIQLSHAGVRKVLANDKKRKDEELHINRNTGPHQGR